VLGVVGIGLALIGVVGLATLAVRLVHGRGGSSAAIALITTYLSKAVGPGFLEHAKQSGLSIPAELSDPHTPPTPQQLVDFVFGIAANYFPRPVSDETEGPQALLSATRTGA